MSNINKAHSAAIKKETPELSLVDDTVILKTKANPLASEVKSDIARVEAEKDDEVSFDEKIQLMKERARNNQR